MCDDTQSDEFGWMGHEYTGPDEGAFPTEPVQIRTNLLGIREARPYIAPAPEYDSQSPDPWPTRRGSIK